MNETVAHWEQHEVERSALEASLRQSEELIIDQAILDRYYAPSRSTAYSLEYAYAVLDDINGKTVLDYGCGAGENTVLLANRGGKVTGVDISPELIEIAEKRVKLHDLNRDVDFKVGSGHELPFDDDTFDVVFGMAILHHLDLDLSSKEVLRVLKPGGYAIFSEPVRNSKTVTFIRNLIPYQAPDVSPFERPLTDSELRTYAADFSTYESKCFNLPYVNLLSLFNFRFNLMDRIYKIDAGIIRYLPFLKFYTTSRVVKIGK